jgi:hypothetical protein
MLDYSIMMPQGILVLKPRAPLGKEDFSGLGAVVNAYLAGHDKLHGVLIQAKKFPGWENFGGFTAHMHFVREYHNQIERVAVVTDSAIGNLAESLAKHFTSAEIRHFHFHDDGKAMLWLTTA